MRALVYNGPREVSVTDVPDAKIEAPTDVLVKITSTNICGSDLISTKGGRRSNLGWRSVTRTWAKSSRQATLWSR
jgi:threonine dehydrogenase-like Zn-dependent dehydrogenase